MAYVVMRRTREIGIRIALGALRSNVIAMVMREAFILIGAGLAIDYSLALALASLIRSQLIGLNPRDPLTFIGSAVVLALAAGSLSPPGAQKNYMFLQVSIDLQKRTDMLAEARSFIRPTGAV
jgi:ABC-type antimicrobial peptide transport system permease subunit